MRPTFQSFLAGSVVVLGALSLGSTSAMAQAPGGGSYRGNIAGYYYSPGGYSGGYYFSPGYYPNRTPSSSATATLGSPTRSYSATARTASSTSHYHDYTTGRSNISVPLAKPWLRPLR